MRAIRYVILPAKESTTSRPPNRRSRMGIDARSRRLIGPALVAAAVSVTLLPQRTHGQDTPVEGTWEVVPSPDADPEAGGNTLLAADALSATNAWAVGFHYNPVECTYCPAPLVMHWDGAQWSLVSTLTIPANKAQLNAVAAVDSDNVWAVGYSDDSCGLCNKTLIEHWDGKSWTVVPSPNPGWANLLYGVAAVSANDAWAVGYRWNNWSTWEPLILHYDGMNWLASDQSEHEYGQLNSVFARAHDDVWAVGSIGTGFGIEGFALHWDGTSWTRFPIPTESGGYIVLRGVSGGAADDVWAVGVYKYETWAGSLLSWARTYHWDGTTWTSVYPGVGGQDSRMYGVTAMAPDDAWAVGGEPGPPGSGIAFQYVTVHWDGDSWSSVETPNQGVLYGVAASSSSNVWAVGFGFDILGMSTGTYTLHYTIGDCPADIDQPGSVDGIDLGMLLASWSIPSGLPGCGGSSPCASDLNSDGLVDGVDLGILLAAWGGCIGDMADEAK